MTEEIEVGNATDYPVLASACRSKFSGRLYVHVGEVHGDEKLIRSHDYAVIVVREVEA